MRVNQARVKSRLVINSTRQEVRVALIEDNRLSELYIERARERGIVGNIYKGRVVRVLPGMQASFVDIGLERAAFLYVTDFFDEYGDAFSQRELEEVKRSKRKAPRIEELMKEGQDVLVQIAKDPMGTKGARLTSNVSLPGRHLVYMPTVAHVGISRKIESDEERRRLRDVVREAQTGEGGFIIRTAAAGQTKEDIVADVEYLEKLWKKVLRRRQGMKAPSLIHEDLNLVHRVIRDYFTDDVEELVVDDRLTYRRIKQFIGQNMPKQVSKKVFLYKEKSPIFHHYKVEKEIDQAVSKKVWLPSGGYLIIDQTEALTSVDVNTGKFVGSRSLEETIMKTNMEAVEEIVHQLRLRNLGGLIILDTIDMERRSNRDKVYKKLEDVLANDKAKTNVLQISELGLVEMTRKRTRESLSRMLCEPCATCEGKGYHKSARTLAYEILRSLAQQLAERKSHENVEIVSHPNVSLILKNEEYDSLIELENKTGRSIVIREQANYHVEHFQINFTGQSFLKPGATSLAEGGITGTSLLGGYFGKDNDSDGDIETEIEADAE